MQMNVIIASITQTLKVTAPQVAEEGGTDLSDIEWEADPFSCCRDNVEVTPMARKSEVTTSMVIRERGAKERGRWDERPGCQFN